MFEELMHVFPVLPGQERQYSSPLLDILCHCLRAIAICVPGPRFGNRFQYPKVPSLLGFKTKASTYVRNSCLWLEEQILEANMQRWLMILRGVIFEVFRMPLHPYLKKVPVSPTWLCNTCFLNGGRTSFSCQTNPWGPYVRLATHRRHPLQRVLDDRYYHDVFVFGWMLVISPCLVEEFMLSPRSLPLNLLPLFHLAIITEEMEQYICARVWQTCNAQLLDAATLLRPAIFTSAP